MRTDTGAGRRFLAGDEPFRPSGCLSRGRLRGRQPKTERHGAAQVGAPQYRGANGVREVDVTVAARVDTKTMEMKEVGIGERCAVASFCLRSTGFPVHMGEIHDACNM